MLDLVLSKICPKKIENKNNARQSWQAGTDEFGATLPANNIHPPLPKSFRSFITILPLHSP